MKHNLTILKLVLVLSLCDRGKMELIFMEKSDGFGCIWANLLLSGLQLGDWKEKYWFIEVNFITVGICLSIHEFRFYNNAYLCFFESVTRIWKLISELSYGKMQCFWSKMKCPNGVPQSDVRNYTGIWDKMRSPGIKAFWSLFWLSIYAIEWRFKSCKPMS